MVNIQVFHKKPGNQSLWKLILETSFEVFHDLEIQYPTKAINLTFVIKQLCVRHVASSHKCIYLSIQNKNKLISVRLCIFILKVCPKNKQTAQFFLLSTTYSKTKSRTIYESSFLCVRQQNLLGGVRFGRLWWTGCLMGFVWTNFEVKSVQISSKPDINQLNWYPNTLLVIPTI